jgi:hypothetical protein
MQAKARGLCSFLQTVEVRNYVAIPIEYQSNSRLHKAREVLTNHSYKHID